VPRVMVNPEILSGSDAVQTLEEGCLSIPGVKVPVTRPAEVTLRWQALDGSVMEEAFAGFAAACVQHERDHLDGRLCIDHLGEDDRRATMDGYGE
ncbi:MAG: peptide deformylase, partial [Paracoccaceae bacterium]